MSKAPAAVVCGHRRFWLKSQPYSLLDMLANDESVDQFAGGTVYQAFLSATNYHRWHGPVSATIVRAFVQPGTYYSEGAGAAAGKTALQVDSVITTAASAPT